MLLCECLSQENRNLAEVIPPCKNIFFVTARSQIAPPPPPAISYVGLDVLFQFVPQILLSISTYMHVLAAGC